MDIIQDPTNTHSPSLDQVSSKYIFIRKKFQSSNLFWNIV